MYGTKGYVENSTSRQACVIDGSIEHPGGESSGTASKRARGESGSSEQINGGRSADGSEVEQLRARLREAEIRLESLKACMPALVMRIDQTGKILSCNRAEQNCIDDHAIGKSVYGYVHATSAVLLREAVAQAIETKAPTHCEITTRGLLGQTQWFETQIGPIVEDGCVGDLHIVAANTTKRRLAEEALRQERDFAEQLIDTAPVIVLVLDSEGKILQFNRHMVELSGYALAEVQGRDWCEVFVPDDQRDRVTAVHSMSVNGEDTSGTINAMLTKDGRTLDIEWFNSNLADNEGETIGVLAVGRDITARQLAERRLRQKESELHQAQKMEAIGRLAGGVAHDFNNLLMAISGCASIALSELESTHPACPYVEEIRRASLNGASVPRQLLNFSRKRELQSTVISVNEVVRHNEAMLRRLLGEDVEVELVLEADDPRVTGDEGQIEQILLNLIVNARDVMPEGGRLTISTEDRFIEAESGLSPKSLRPGRYVTLSVADTGSGMDETTLARAFEPFFTTKKPGVGTGLGLSTVYGIVQQYRGAVEIDSSVGRGTTFTVYLPHVDAPTTSDLPMVTEEELEAERRHSVLLVEDERLVRLTLRHYLEKAGYRVHEAASGDEALELVRAGLGPIDLLLTDLVLPGINGCQLADHVTHLQPETRVLYMSAHAEERMLREGRLRPGVRLLEKPFTEETLLKKVRDALDN